MAKQKKNILQEFERCCEAWLDFFGLKDWAIAYKIDNDPTNSACMIYHDDAIESRAVTLAINPEIDHDEVSINQRAFHEVAEVLLLKLRILAGNRFVTEPQIQEEIHNIIARLENSVFKKVKHAISRPKKLTGA